MIGAADVVSRFGGDKFVVVQYRGSPRSTRPGRWPEKSLARCISSTYQIDGHQVAGGASIEIAIAPVDGHTTPTSCCAMPTWRSIRRSAESRGTWRRFEAEMEAHAQTRRNLELDLRKAVANEAFELDYQPLFDPRRRVVGVRSAACAGRIRSAGWCRRRNSFPVAEETGLILEIGKQVLRKACLECGRWPAISASPSTFRRSSSAGPTSRR